MIGIVVLLFFLVALMFKDPLLDREWDEDVGVLAGITLNDDRFTITNARNWTYEDGAIIDQDYFTETYTYDGLQGATFYLQPLDATGLVAHTFVVFHFNESYGEYRDLGISVETRRESGEEYSLLGGLFRKFELTHTWATEQDLVDRRTRFYDYSVIPYSITVPLDQQQAILKTLLAQTQRLAVEPVFYNTALHNCTNSLAQYINRTYPESIPWHWSFIITGLSASYLETLGYISHD